ncbi:MAG: phosphodiester glycosidase family protein, partial [Chloroflexota bacterium]
TATLNPDTGWQEVQPGLERRHLFVFNAQNQFLDRLAILRLDPALFAVRVAYRPGEAQSLEAWQAETDALITVNGGFFTAENYATGLTIVEGQPFGASYNDFAGMLAVTDSDVTLRWLRERPFDPQEPLQYAVQSFPVLVKPGGVLGFPDEDGVPARRTVIAQDRNGRLLFIIAPNGFMTLHQMSQWLAQSDLDLHIALNLDGGPSSGLLLAHSDLALPAFSLLPAVITVHNN